jgi:hypothetical protein
MTSRKATNELIELCEAGILDWETVARECLSYMSESAVEDMGYCAGFIEEEEEEE